MWSTASMKWLNQSWGSGKNDIQSSFHGCSSSFHFRNWRITTKVHKCSIEIWIRTSRITTKAHNFKCSFDIWILFVTWFTYHQYRVGRICPWMCVYLLSWQDSSELFLQFCPYLGQPESSWDPGVGVCRFVGKPLGTSQHLKARLDWGRGSNVLLSECFLLGAEGKNGERPNTAVSLYWTSRTTSRQTQESPRSFGRISLRHM